MGLIAPLSIRAKAPMAAAVLVLVVGVATSAAAYFVIRRTLLTSADDRLTSLTTQFRETFRGSMVTSRARAASAADAPALLAYLRDPSPAREPAARAAMQPGNLLPELAVRSELRDGDGRLLLVATHADAPYALFDQVDGAALAKLVPEGGTNGASETSTVGYGVFRAEGDVVLYPTVARIGTPAAGYYVAWRRLSNSPQARTQIASLLGSEAAFYLLNRDNTAWSDGGRLTASSPQPPKLGGVIEFERPGRGRVRSAAAPVDGTPWAFAIEFPASAILAPARTFLKTEAIIASACIVLGMLVAWLMSRRVTTPLHTLTQAADAIAAGDIAGRVTLDRADELGRLASSFNTMAERIEASHVRLERLLAERTEKLRAAEESLARREKLALIGQLASGIGHEIRNPLGVMANAIYYLDAVLPDTTPEVREYMNILNRQIKLSAKIVNDLLDFSRATPAHREKVGLPELVESRLRRLALNGTAVETDLPANLPYVEVDPVHAGQVIDNLLSNALQAMEPTGHASHKNARVRVCARATGDGFVRLEVSDSGPGIPAENVAKIFEPLFTTKARGFGLGLALSKSLAQANGGDLALVSEAGESATFALTLPIAGNPA
jgi:signal transduction histidine kinase